MRISILRCSLLLITLGAFACSGDDDPADASVDPTDGGSSADAGTEPQAVYTLGIRIRQPDGTTNASYLQQLPDIEGVTELTTQGAREFASQLRYRRRGDSLYLESAGEPTIVRFRYDEAAGELTERETLSFANLGFTSASTHFLSDTKAYALNASGAQIAVYNPSEMILTGATIDLSTALESGFALGGVAFQNRGNRTFVALAFSNFSNPQAPSVAPFIRVVILDNENDSIVSIINDTRCAQMSGTMQADDGDIYVLGDNGFNLLIPGTPSCIIRIPAGGETFDNYLYQLPSSLGGREATALVPLEGLKALVFALYPEELDQQNPLSVVFDPVRRPWIVDLETQTATVVAGAPLTKVGNRFDVGDETWFSTSGSFEEMDLYRIDVDNAEATLRMNVEGQVLSVERFP